MQVPLLPDARLRGARLCIVGDRRGAVAEYDVNGTLVSYFVLPTAGPASTTNEPIRFDHGSRAGYHEVAWQEAGLIHVMMGTLPLPRLEQFARHCIAQMSVAVAWLRQDAAHVRDEA